MISLDQVLLLQEKVESAVEKITSLTERIAQLESDNDALNRKCLELTKALEEKTEFVSTLESAQGKIEESILMTINRLDSVEDAILGADTESGENAAVASETISSSVATPTPTMAVESEEEESEEQPEESEITVPAVSEAGQSADEPFVYEQESSGLLHKTEQAASQTMEQPKVFETTEEEEEETDSPAPSALDGQFDIF
ncbi:MAG: cell division protein ZapB [Spirochaetales bacterium]|nr:cell division protein ZapB [Spirochaetales bacterium]